MRLWFCRACTHTYAGWSWDTSLVGPWGTALLPHITILTTVKGIGKQYTSAKMHLYLEVTRRSYYSYSCKLCVMRGSSSVVLFNEKLNFVRLTAYLTKQQQKKKEIWWSTAVSYSHLWCWLSSHQKLIPSCLLLSPTPGWKLQSCIRPNCCFKSESNRSGPVCCVESSQQLNSNLKKH